MQTSSYENWMRRPLSAAVCPTPDIWPEARPEQFRAQPSLEMLPVGVPVATSQIASPHQEGTDTMTEEKLRIIKLVEDGKISAAEAARLLEALDKSDAKPSPRELKRKWIHIKVQKDGEQNVDVRIPLALLKFGFRFAPKHMHMKMSNGLSKEHKERIREIKQRARAAKARARAEAHAHIREQRGHGRAAGAGAGAGAGFQAGLESSINDAIDEAMTESFESMGDIFGEDFNLDLDRILQMAQDPAFDGKILEVHNDDEDEHVTIELE
jgi:hypothetical protein